MTHALAAAAVALALTGCATTVVDEESDDTTGVVDDSTPDTTPSVTPIAGDAADLLPVISDEMRSLSDDIGGDGDQQATFARIDDAWNAIRDEVESTRPELFLGLEAAIEMARTAVATNRPADADKAYSILTDLIDAFENPT